MKMRKICLFLLAALSAASLAAKTSTFEPADAMPIYKCGEKARFSLKILDNNKPVTSGKYTIIYTLGGGKEIGRQTVDLAQGNPATVSATLNEPGFILARVVNEKGNNVLTASTKGRKTALLAGAAFEPEKIKMGYAMPEDFTTFWENGRREIAGNPVKLDKVEKFSSGSYHTFYVTVNSLNNKPLTGYLTIPKAKGPFPVYITIPGAGPGISSPTHWANQNVITLTMNVHHFPTADNAEEQKARYNAAMKGRPPYSTWGAGNRDTYFFRSVYVGIDRVINHIAAMPEWDKKHMVIDGSSQGGGAALLLAGYNKNITALAANVPSLCDQGGFKLGRASGGPRLSKTENVDGYAPYFDAGNFAKSIQVPALVSCGFLDTTCAPSSIYAVYNQLKGPRQMIHVPREGHTISREFSAARSAFVKKHLGLNLR